MSRKMANSEHELQALAELDGKLLVARDRIRQVARGQATGFYWHGRPGTSKTHTVLATLEEVGIEHRYHRGHITPGGLMEILERHFDGIIVLDDVSAIFDDKKAVQYLLAALGRQQGRPLDMGYHRMGKHISFQFHGGIICISNLPVTPIGMLAAFKSRVRTLQHNPTGLMLIALCRHRIVKDGWPAGDPKLTAEEINEVIDWVEQEAGRLNVPVDLRMILEAALPDYLAWKEKQTEAFWKDLVTTTLEEEVSSLAYTPPGGSRASASARRPRGRNGRSSGPSSRSTRGGAIGSGPGSSAPGSPRRLSTGAGPRSWPWTGKCPKCRKCLARTDETLPTLLRDLSIPPPTWAGGLPRGRRTALPFPRPA
jgi:hypothetical protein